MKSGKLLAAVAVVGALAGCAENPYSKYYTPISLAHRNLNFASISGGKPNIIHGGNLKQDIIRMEERGYIMVGYSLFNGGDVNEDGALIEGKKIGASAVIVYSKYTSTITSQIPITMPNSQTSNTSSFGAFGSHTFFANGTTTSYGTQTIYIPHTTQRFNYIATYWKNLRH